jgi:3-isopropylmalate/(R)-2-methylmalate dehydratase small subunit
MEKTFKRQGTCHVFGDGIPLDEGVMAFKFAIERVTDTKILIPHLFEQVDSTFAARVKPGDVVVAGKNFGCGKPHIQGFLAMAALNLSVICESMPHKSLRRAVAAGLPVLAGCAGCTDFLASGDGVEVDFATGEVRNLAKSTARQFAPMAPILRDIVANYGTAGNLRAWLAEHPELAARRRETAA